MGAWLPHRAPCRCLTFPTDSVTSCEHTGAAATAARAAEARWWVGDAACSSDGRSEKLASLYARFVGVIVAVVRSRECRADAESWRDGRSRPEPATRRADQRRTSRVSISCITDDGMPGTSPNDAGVDIANRKNEKQVVGDFVWDGNFAAVQKGMETIDLAAVFSFSYSYDY